MARRWAARIAGRTAAARRRSGRSGSRRPRDAWRRHGARRGAAWAAMLATAQQRNGKARSGLGEERLEARGAGQAQLTATTAGQVAGERQPDAAAVRARVTA